MKNRKQINGLNSIRKFKSHLCELSKNDLSEKYERVIRASRLCENLSEEIDYLESTYKQIINNENGMDVSLLTAYSEMISQSQLKLIEAIKVQQHESNEHQENERELLELQQSKKILEKLIDRKIDLESIEQSRQEDKIIDERMLLRFEQA